VKYRLIVLVEKGEKNYGAYAPDVPGCGSTGSTPEEALANIKEALESHFEAMLEIGEPLPQVTYIDAQPVFIDVDLPTNAARAAS
jgi:predicted RNase H-like HicB family nuclease